MEPQSRRPKARPSKITDDPFQRALGVCAALETAGWTTVHEKMRALGMDHVPSTASSSRVSALVRNWSVSLFEI